MFSTIGNFYTFTAMLAIFTFVFGDPAGNYYRELECVPGAGDGQPTYYNCNIIQIFNDAGFEEYVCDEEWYIVLSFDLGTNSLGVLDKITENKCFYQGKEYAIDETIKEDVVNDRCIVECTCIQIYTTNKARWSCVDIECPELFHRESDCRYLHDGHDKCCSTSKICGEEKPEGTCEYGGNTYIYGQKFYPNEERCKHCICGEGFNGSLTEPWCETFSCNLYLHYLNYIREGCLPTYYETDSCCPIPIWRCPKSDDKVVTPKNVDVCDSCKDQVCKFGKLTLARGQKLSPSTSEDSKDVDCTCQVPPHLTCVMLNKQ